MTMPSKSNEYNPIQGDILSFLNEVAAKKTEPVPTEPERKHNDQIEKKPVKGMNLNSEEMFPSLGDVAPSLPSTSST